jgi:carboxyl-terminal processing protease
MFNFLAIRLMLALTVLAVQSPAVMASAQPALVSIEARAPSAAEPGPVVAQAFNLLMDYFVFPPTSADVLNGAWSGGLSALQQKGVEAAPLGRPAFTSQRESDLRLFIGQYARLAAAAEGKLDKAELDRAIVKGMAVSMNEGHTFYLTPDEFQVALSQIRGRYVGIGINLNQERRVLEVFEDSPAEAGGVRPGDLIVAVDGAPIEGLAPHELSQRIRGEDGTPVELTIRREGTPELIVLKLVRAVITGTWLSSRILDDGVGYLRIRTFPLPNALGDFRRAMDRLEGADIRALVIDVRANGGGSVETGVEVASRFIRTGPLYQQVNRYGRERTVTAFGDYWNRDTPIAVLTDGNSGSMSEILASAIRENGVGTVIGTRTAGVLAAGHFHPLVDGSGLSITVEVIRSGRGETLNGVGLEPDLTVELDPQQLAAGRDNQLDAALQYVSQQAADRPAAFSPSGTPLLLDPLPVAA